MEGETTGALQIARGKELGEELTGSEEKSIWGDAMEQQEKALLEEGVFMSLSKTLRQAILLNSSI